MAQQIDDLDTDPSNVKIRVENLYRQFRIVPKYSDNDNIKKLCSLRDQDLLLFEKCMSEERIKSISTSQIPKTVTDFSLWNDSKDSSQILNLCQPPKEAFDQLVEFLNQKEEILFTFSPSVLLTALQTIDNYRTIEYQKIVKQRTSNAKNYSSFVKKMANQFKLLGGEESIAGFDGRQYQEFKGRVLAIIKHKSLL